VYVNVFIQPLLRNQTLQCVKSKARVLGFDNGKEVNAHTYTSVEGHNLQEHSIVFSKRRKGKGYLPGVRYHIVRGAFGYSRCCWKDTRRSKYGAKRP